MKFLYICFILLLTSCYSIKNKNTPYLSDYQRSPNIINLVNLKIKEFKGSIFLNSDTIESCYYQNDKWGIKILFSEKKYEDIKKLLINAFGKPKLEHNGFIEYTYGQIPGCVISLSKEFCSEKTEFNNFSMLIILSSEKLLKESKENIEVKEIRRNIKHPVLKN